MARYNDMPEGVVTDSDKFSENVNVMIQPLAGMNITLDQFVENSERQVKTLVTDGVR